MADNVMRRVSLRNLAAHKVRLLLTVLSVVLGTAFVTGSFVFTDTLQKTFDGIFANAAQGVDTQVTNPRNGSSGVPIADIAKIKAAAGVRKVGVELSQEIVLLGSDGKAVQGGGAPSVGSAYYPADERVDDPENFISGHPPQAAGQIALNQGAATLAKLSVGQSTRVLLTAGSPIRVTLVGIYRPKSETGGYIGALFTPAQANRLFGDGKHVDAVDVAGNGIPQTQLRANVAAAVPDMKVQTGDKVRADTKKAVDTALSFVNYFLLAFGAIALLVGTFIIYNTFSMIVAQRLRELALLRAIGASRRQISRSVLGEAVIVGFIGGLLGIAGGIGLAYGLRALLNAFGTGLPGGSLQVEPRTIVVALLVGVVVTSISAYAPARRASKIPPVAAMREEFASTGSSLRRRTAIGLVFAVIAVLALAAGAVGKSGGGSAGLVGIGALAGIVAVLLGAPALSRPIVGTVGLLLRPFGPVGRLSRTNAVRNPRRTAATAFALTLGLMLVSAIAVLGQSTKGSINALVDNGVTADYLLIGPNSIGVPIGAGQAAAKVTGVETATILHGVAVQINGQTTTGLGVEGSLSAVFKNQFLAGTGTFSGHEIIAGKTWAADHHLSVGSSVTAKSFDGRSVVLTLVGIYRDNQLSGPWVGSDLLYREVTPVGSRNDDVVLVKASKGTNLTTLRNDLLTATAPYVVVQVETREQFKGSQAKQINGLLAVLYGLLALALVIAVLGIINTLALSVVERRREIGMLRAVGMVRGQVRRTIYLESALIALFGAIVGVALGLVFGALFVRTLRDQGLNHIDVPWTQAVVFLVLSAVVGVLAALWPAVRAARTPPLAAISEV